MTKYILSVTMRDGATRRYIHDLADGARAGIMEAKPGHRGWLWYYNEYDPTFDGSPYHRLHTSVIQSVEHDGSDIVIVTQNTIYRLTAIEE